MHGSCDAAANPAPPSAQQGYGLYILATGQDVVGRHEMVMGSYIYETKFKGLDPILDLAPGRCWFTRQSPQTIIAVDNAEELVNFYSRMGLHIMLGDAYALPFGENHFQGVFCCWLFEHLTDPLRAGRELRRVLQPGGYACVIVPTPHDMLHFYDDCTHIRPFTEKSLSQLATTAGFSRHRVTYLPWVRGIRHILRAAGERWANAYMKFADTYLRSLGIVNKTNVMFEAWK
jgi:ubiquinone/menaquinone biosynthesis C-methylase UbiE